MKYIKGYGETIHTIFATFGWIPQTEGFHGRNPLTERKKGRII